MKNVILIHGKMQSGKNQFATYLESELKALGYTVKQDLFAGPLKHNSKEDFKVLAQYLNELADKAVGTELEALLRIKDENWYEDKTTITRILLQTYGTEIFRKRVSDNYWIEKLADRVKQSAENFILVTDLRFKNEISSFADLVEFGTAVTTVKIERTIDRDDSPINEHPSEKDLDDYKQFDFTIENNSTLEELQASAKEAALQIAKLHVVEPESPVYEEEAYMNPKEDEIKTGKLSEEEKIKIDKALEAYDYLLPKVLTMIQRNKEKLMMVNTSEMLNLVDKTTEIIDCLLSNSLDVDDIDDNDIDRLINEA